MEAPTIISASVPGTVIIRCLNVDPDGQPALPVACWSIKPPPDGTFPVGRRAWDWQSKTIDGDHTQYTYDLSTIFPTLKHAMRAALIFRYAITPPTSTSKTAASAASIGDAPLITWANLTWGTTCDNLGTSVNWANGLVTQQLQCTDYPFTDLNEPVLGIRLRVRRWAFASQVHDTTIQLMKGGTPIGDNKAAAGNWSQVGFENKDYGGATDTWGTGWSADDILDPGFGAALTATSVTPSGGGYIDCMTITVWTAGKAYQFTDPQLVNFTWD